MLFALLVDFSFANFRIDLAGTDMLRFICARKVGGFKVVQSVVGGHNLYFF